MTNAQLEEWFEDQDGLAGVGELARVLEEDEDTLRRFARRQGIKRVGNTFVFTLMDAEDLLDALDEEDPDEDEDLDDHAEE
jgi:hypothetical protein